MQAASRPCRELAIDYCPEGLFSPVCLLVRELCVGAVGQYGLAELESAASLFWTSAIQALHS